MRTVIRNVAAAGMLAVALAACSQSPPPAEVPSESPAEITAGEEVEESTVAEAPAVVSEASIAGLRILLTNDDSMQASNESNSDGLGLYEMRRALCAAGADVVVIGPWAVQSGRGTAVTNSGMMSVAAPIAFPAGYEDDCSDAPTGGPVYGLCLSDGACTPESGSGTPGDTVRFALRGGLESLVGWEGYPDLVVSGPNSGLNVSSSVNDSGTVGAAISAVEHRVPGFAISASWDAERFFPPENYSAASEWAVQLLESLAARDMLNEYEYVINVNYPDASADAPIGAATFSEVGTAIGAYHYYTEEGDNSWKVGLKLCEGLEICEESRANADSDIARGGTIAVGAITPDRTYAPEELHALESLAALRAFIAADAPAPIQ